MQASKILSGIGSVLASSRLGRDLSAIELDDVLGFMGLARRRSHLLQNLALLGAGAAVGAGVALLLAPASGSDTRQRLSRSVEKLADQAAELHQDGQAPKGSGSRAHNGPGQAAT